MSSDAVDRLGRFRLATRSSRLALWQANFVAGLLRAALPTLEVVLVEVSTVGDRVLANPLREFGGLGVFTKEVQAVVLAGEADAAVHSLKDLPTAAVPGMVLAGTPERGAVADVLVLPAGADLKPHPVANSVELLLQLPMGAVVGTGSPRRQAQLKFARPDLLIAEVRGNVETRLKKLDSGEYAALVLAAAGLERLGLGDRISIPLGAPLMYPAVGQGAIGVECAASDARAIALVREISHAATWGAVTAERTVLAELRAGCHAPVGVTARVVSGQLNLEAVVFSVDGATRLSAAAVGDLADPVSLGKVVAGLLEQQGARALISAAEHGN